MTTEGRDSNAEKDRAMLTPEQIEAELAAKDARIAELEAREEYALRSFDGMHEGWGKLYDENNAMKQRIAELEAEVAAWKEGPAT